MKSRKIPQITRRSRRGCLNCKQRRVKCNETRPTCSNCYRRNDDCIYGNQESPSSTSSPTKFSFQIQQTTSSTTDRALQRQTSVLSSKPGQYRKPIRVQKDPDNPHFLIFSYATPTATQALTKSPPASAGVTEKMNQDSMGIQANSPPQENAFFSLPDDQTDGYTNDSSRPSITLESLYMVRGEEPPTPQILAPISSSQYDRMRYLYTHEYAKGMDALFETSWYSHHGLTVLQSNQKTSDMMVGMLTLFESTKSDNYDQMRLLPLTESRMIWRLMCMPRSEVWTMHDPLLDDVTSRIDVLETLLTGRQYIPPPSLPPILPQHGTAEYRRQLFWRNLGNFVAQDQTAAATSDTIAAETLERLRSLLDGNEGRDVLYSIAVVRHFGPKTKGEVNQTGTAVVVGGQLVEQERSMFAVAKKFVEDEAAGKGTSQVVQRVCGMAVRSWAMLSLW